MSGDVSRRRVRVGSSAEAALVVLSAPLAPLQPAPPELEPLSVRPRPRTQPAPPHAAQPAQWSKEKLQLREQPWDVQRPGSAPLPLPLSQPPLVLRMPDATTAAAAGQHAPARPGSWTPSKLASRPGSGGSCGPALSAAEALEREVAELNASDRAVNDARALGHGVAIVEPAQRRAMPKLPLAGTVVVQHNNLFMRDMANGSMDISDSSTASPAAAGIACLRGRLMDYTGTRSHRTAVVAFDAPAEQQRGAIVATAGVPGGGGSGCSRAAGLPQQVVRAPRLLPSGHVSSACRTPDEWAAAHSTAMAASGRATALALPGPTDGLVQCYVRRLPGLLGASHCFELRTERGDELLATARRRVKAAASSFLLSTSADCSVLGRSDPGLLAKVKGSLLGTHYLVRGHGGAAASHKGFNAQLLAACYEPTVNQLKAAPRTMSVVVPSPESQAWAAGPPSGEHDSLCSCMDAARGRTLAPSYERDLLMLHSVEPHYDPVKQAHYLDFKGRVSKVSAKNCQLVAWDHNSNRLGRELVLLFGKKGGSEYALDFAYPLSPLQAFALALTRVDSKLCHVM